MNKQKLTPHSQWRSEQTELEPDETGHSSFGFTRHGPEGDPFYVRHTPHGSAIIFRVENGWVFEAWSVFLQTVESGFSENIETILGSAATALNGFGVELNESGGSRWFFETAGFTPIAEALDADHLTDDDPPGLSRAEELLDEAKEGG